MSIKEKQYKECIDQTVGMLHSYRNEPTDTHFATMDIKETIEMLDTIFSEMMLYLPEKDKKELEQQYNRER